MPDHSLAAIPEEVSPERFADAFAGVRTTRRAPWLTPYTAKEFKRMRCFLSYGGKVGGALNPTAEGVELVSVFNRGGPRGAGASMARFLVGHAAIGWIASGARCDASMSEPASRWLRRSGGTTGSPRPTGTTTVRAGL